MSIRRYAHDRNPLTPKLGQSKRSKTQESVSLSPTHFLKTPLAMSEADQRKKKTETNQYGPYSQKLIAEQQREMLMQLFLARQTRQRR